MTLVAVSSCLSFCLFGGSPTGVIVFMLRLSTPIHVRLTTSNPFFHVRLTTSNPFFPLRCNTHLIDLLSLIGWPNRPFSFVPLFLCGNG